MKVKLFAIHLFFIVISFGIKYYHLQGPNLIWNMTLALIVILQGKSLKSELFFVNIY